MSTNAISNSSVPAGFKDGEAQQFLVSLETATETQQSDASGPVPAGFKDGEVAQFLPNLDVQQAQGSTNNTVVSGGVPAGFKDGEIVSCNKNMFTTTEKVNSP